MLLPVNCQGLFYFAFASSNSIQPMLIAYWNYLNRDQDSIEPPTTKVAGIWGPPSTLHIRTLTPRNTQSA